LIGFLRFSSSIARPLLFLTVALEELVSKTSRTGESDEHSIENALGQNNFLVCSESRTQETLAFVQAVPAEEEQYVEKFPNSPVVLIVTSAAVNASAVKSSPGLGRLLISFWLKVVARSALLLRRNGVWVVTRFSSFLSWARWKKEATTISVGSLEWVSGFATDDPNDELLSVEARRLIFDLANECPVTRNDSGHWTVTPQPHKPNLQTGGQASDAAVTELATNHMVNVLGSKPLQTCKLTGHGEAYSQRFLTVRA
jgi:hypothetical protein